MDQNIEMAAEFSLDRLIDAEHIEEQELVGKREVFGKQTIPGKRTLCEWQDRLVVIKPDGSDGLRPPG